MQTRKQRREEHTVTATRADFLQAYRLALAGMYDWAQDSAKLDRYMESVEQTIDPAKTFNTWTANGEALSQAWKAVGEKGTPSLSRLRLLK